MSVFEQDLQALYFGSMPVEHIFLTEYMPAARGDYVKVYLTCLYHSRMPNDDTKVEDVSRELGLDSSVVENAVRYWERRGLMVVIGGEAPRYQMRSAIQRALSGEPLSADNAFVQFSERVYELFGESRKVRPSWIVRWENPGDSLFPGKYQVRADAMKGDTIMLRYNLDTESKAGVFSTMYVIKQHLDALSGEYAFGLSKDDETEIVVQIKREFASHFLAETLAYSHYCYIKTDTREDVLFVNDNEILDYRSVMNANDGVSKLRRPTLEIEEDGSGGWKLRVNIHTMRLEECRNTLADCQKKGIERIYYCCEGGSYPILSASVDDALHTIEDYYFLFDTIEIGKNLPLDPSTRTLGEYLITYLTEDPQETATADNVIRAESADGSRDFSVSYVTDLPYSRDEHLEEEYAAITEDLRKADSSYYDNRHRKEADISFTNNGTGISVRLYDVPGDGFPLNALAEVKDLIHENGLDNGHYSLRFSFTPENAREDELYRSISFYISNGAFVYDVSSYSFTEEECPNVADYLASNPWYSIRKATYSD